MEENKNPWHENPGKQQEYKKPNKRQQKAENRFLDSMAKLTVGKPKQDN